MPTIVISYRRSDSSAIAGRIFDHLTTYYGEESVFMDIDNIPFGTDFRTQIHETLQRTDIVLAVIGANWLGIGAGGAVRMSEPTDPVRVEIETALSQKTPIIPVLVDGAKMPDSAALPTEFGNFAYLNAAEVATGRDFRTHVDRLIGAIDRTVSGKTGVEVPRLASGRTQDAGKEAEKSAQMRWLSNALRFLAVPWSCFWSPTTSSSTRSISTSNICGSRRRWCPSRSAFSSSGRPAAAPGRRLHLQRPSASSRWPA